MEQDRVKSMRSFAEAYTAAWCSQDASSVAALFEENGSLKVNEDAPAVGRKAIKAVAQGFMTAFPDMQVFMDDLRLQDDGAIYHWTLTGTNTGPGGTGRAVRISGFEVCRLARTVSSLIHVVTLIALITAGNSSCKRCGSPSLNHEDNRNQMSKDLSLTSSGAWGSRPAEIGRASLNPIPGAGLTQPNL
jgi:ketosteroid isomerase-like protein